jgi:geranylgeranyl transferase type-1 subunit beta
VFSDHEQAAFTSSLYDSGHLAMTYTALATLKILGDDFSRINKQAIIRALKSLQRDNGW